MSNDSEAIPQPRKGQGGVKLRREEVARRLSGQFYDPAFDTVRSEIESVIEIAWTNYDEYYKSPRKQKAGSDFQVLTSSCTSGGSKRDSLSRHSYCGLIISLPG